jgi:hypothetical protein
MRANRDSIMKPAAAARRYRRLAGRPGHNRPARNVTVPAQRPSVQASCFVQKQRFMLAS